MFVIFKWHTFNLNTRVRRRRRRPTSIIITIIRINPGRARRLRCRRIHQQRTPLATVARGRLRERRSRLAAAAVQALHRPDDGARRPRFEQFGQRRRRRIVHGSRISARIRRQGYAVGACRYGRCDGQLHGSDVHGQQGHERTADANAGGVCVQGGGRLS